jgi:hypothetical protein
VIYTVGNRINYQEAIDKYGTIQKQGRSKDYGGGIVFESIEKAEYYLKLVDRESDWCVWGVNAHWKMDTRPSVTKLWHYLLIDADIIPLNT